MKLPAGLEDRYLKEVLFNDSLHDLPDEAWKLIEGFENYAISTHGRVKSLERWVASSRGGEQKLSEKIMKLQTFRYFNKHLKAHFYNIKCNLSYEGKVYGKSVARLVYHHFVEKFDMDDQSLRVSFKDDNRFHVHFSNLELMTRHEIRSKALNSGRGKKGNYRQAVSQYTVEGDFVASYKDIYEASKTLGIAATYILPVINKKKTTAGKFRWFAKDYTPTKEDFIPEGNDEPENILNTSIWIKLGKPSIDKKNPPACMNLSLKDLPGEIWKPIPGLEQYFTISNKGRIKRLNTWTQNKNKTFWKEHIISLFVLHSDNKADYLYTKLSCKGIGYPIKVNRMLYYCFIEKFDLNNKKLVVVNENQPHWDIDLSKLRLQSVTDILSERNKKYASVVRTIRNSKKTFNDLLWKKLGKPPIDKENPPAVLDLLLRDLPKELWKPLPGFIGKYVISNKGRVKRLSGWGAGNHYYEEEQIISLNVKNSTSSFLFFKLHPKEDINPKILSRMLYYCFVEEFDLNSRILKVVNRNDRLWEIDLSRLSLCSMAEFFKNKK